MISFLKKHWMALGVGAVVGVGGVMLYEKQAHAAGSTPTSAPSNVTVSLQPGATTVAVKQGGSVMFTLPTGATWDSSTTPISPINPTAVQPTGSSAYNLVMNGGAGTVFKATARWLDSSGTSKTTIVNIAVTA